MNQKRLSSNTLNYQRMITQRASESVLLALSAVNGLSRLTKLMTSKGAGMADSIWKFSNWPITFQSNRTADSNSNRISKLRRSLLYLFFCFVFCLYQCNWLPGKTRLRMLNSTFSLAPYYLAYYFFVAVGSKFSISHWLCRSSTPYNTQTTVWACDYSSLTDCMTL